MLAINASEGSSISIEESLEWEEYKGDIPFWKHAIAGSCAGVLEHISMFPLDTAKTRLQAFSPAASETSIYGALRSTIQQDGVRGLFRGAAAITSGCIPAHAALFGVYEGTKNFLQLDDGAHHPIKAAACGALATMCHDTILTPLDVVKQRLQLGCYKNSYDCLKTIIQHEGVTALFRSMPVTILMNIPFGALMVSANESFKKILRLEEEEALLEHSSQKSTLLPKYFLAAGLAGAFAASITTPFDVIKTRLQTQDCALRKPCCDKVMPNGAVSGANSTSSVAGATACPLAAKRIVMQENFPKYTNFFDTARSIYVNEGIRAFYRGVHARVLLAFPSSAVCWGTYETAKWLLGA